MAIEQSILVELLTRPGCHLCDAAREVTARVCEAEGVEFVEINIDQNPALRAQHNTEVPVVKVAGVVKDFWQINPRRLAKAIRATQ